MMSRSLIKLLVLAPGVATAIRSNQSSWELLAPISHAPRQEHSVIALSDTTVAILGGIVPNLETEGFNTTDWAQFYDITTDSWAVPNPGPVQVNHPNAAALDGELYLLGGLTPDSDGAWRAFSESWKYSPSNDVWVPLDPIPEGRETGSAAVGVYNGVIFLAGGMRLLEPIGQEGEQDTVDYVSAFDTKSGSWIDLPEKAKLMPEGRDHAAVSVVDGKLYVLGGRTRGQRNVRDTVFTLDLEDLEKGWITEEGRMPTPRGGVVGGAVENKIYVFGGEGNTAEGSDGVFDNVEVYDIATGLWEELDPMRLPRHGGGAATIGNRIYLPGGGTSEGGSPVHANDVFVAPRKD